MVNDTQARLLALVLGLLALGFGGGCVDPEVKRIAAEQMGCTVGKVTVTAHRNSDVEDTYDVRGCGKRGKLTCAAPDFECFFVSDAAAKP